MNHTPTPWIVIPDYAWQGRHPLHDARFIATSNNVDIFDRGEDCDPPRTWCFANDKDVIICTMPDAENQKANAEFIVRACNSHDALLAACKDALSTSHIDQDCAQFALTALAEIRGILQLAIANATKE